MALLENIGQATQSLVSNPLRSILTLIGIAVGISAVLYVVILGELTQRRINERMESLGVNVLSIRPGASYMHGVHTGGSVVNLSWDDAKEIDSISAVVTSTVPVYSSNGMTKYRDKNWSTRITGTTPDYSQVDNSRPVVGRFFNEVEMQERAQVCVLGATVKDELFAEESALDKTISVKFKRFKVIGVLESKGESWFNPDNQIFIPLTTAQERMAGKDYLSSILAQLSSADAYEEALFDIETTLRRNHRLRDDQANDFRVRRQDFYLSTIQDTNKELAEFIILIALISLVVGGIGIANMMLVSVTERTREIGIRRAVGANRLMIMIQFLVEAITLGFAGGLIGVAGGMAINVIVVGDDMTMPWFWMFNSVLICMTIGIMAGMYPAYRAANVDVIEALHHE
ncbi:ABC transporter permease [bacterium AH-315-J21]|nr:ABC transporter permease [bacterium AH-315-J21]